MVFNVNNYNLKNIKVDITKSKGFNFTKKDNAKTYKKGNIIIIKLIGTDNFNTYNFEFILLAPLALLNDFKMNKNVKINEFIDENVAIEINSILDSEAYGYCDFYIEKLDNNIFKFNIYVKNYEFLSPKYNMFMEFIINYDEI